MTQPVISPQPGRKFTLMYWQVKQAKSQNFILRLKESFSPGSLLQLAKDLMFLSFVKLFQLVNVLNLCGCPVSMCCWPGTEEDLALALDNTQ